MEEHYPLLTTCLIWLVLWVICTLLTLGLTLMFIHLLGRIL